MTGLDCNVLLQLFRQEHPKHRATADTVRREQTAGNTLLCAPQIIAEFLHVATDARRFTPATPMVDALAWVEDFLVQPGVERVFPNEHSLRLSLAWMRTHRLGRKRILDTLLAATLHRHGVRRLLTSNPDDFRVFGVFELIVP